MSAHQAPPTSFCRKIEAAREIAGTVAASANRVYLSSESLLLNMSELDVSNKKK